MSDIILRDTHEVELASCSLMPFVKLHQPKIAHLDFKSTTTAFDPVSQMFDDMPADVEASACLALLDNSRQRGFHCSSPGRSG